MPATDAPPLQSSSPTQEQKNIIEAAATSCQLVISGPGTGKTYTLLKRIEYLLLEEGLEPNQIIVLSFSRAAVREIVERLQQSIRQEGMHEDLLYTTIRTFDSFSYGLLSSIGKVPDIFNSTYDETIAKASAEIKNGDSGALEFVLGLGHIIVDEVQDLVGPRAALVQSLLTASECGFTLLGDPAQAIYDYQIRESQLPEGLPGRDLKSSVFLKWLRDPDRGWQLEERHLTKNHRASGYCFYIADKYRDLILQNNSTVLDKLRKDLNDLKDAGSVAQSGDLIKKPQLGWKTAILCRTNNEALHVHDQLRKQGIPHSLATDVYNTGLPPWIARIFSSWKSAEIQKSRFEEQWAEKIGKTISIQPQDAWQSLVQIMNKPDNTTNLKLADLKRRLAGRVDHPGFSNLEKSFPLRVSTIHRAKGREYDRVVILNPRGFEEDYQERIEESRVFYVACTRPKKELLGLKRTGLPSHMGSISSFLGGRRRGWAKTRDELFIEGGLPGDVDEKSMARSNDTGSSLKIQDYIWNKLRVGDAVTLWYLEDQWLSKYYIQTRDGITLGEMSEYFSRDLQTIMFKARHLYGRPAEKITGLTVADIRSVVIPGFVANLPEPYCDSGFFLAIRLEGVLIAGRPNNQSRNW